MASPAANVAWQKFEQCLEAHGLTFEDIKDADAGARLDMIVSMGSSTAVTIGGNNSLIGNTTSPADAVAAVANSHGATKGKPSLSGVEMALVSSKWNSLVPTGANGAAIPQGPSANNFGAGASFVPQLQSSLPFLDPSHGRSLLHRGTTELLEELKANLAAGNAPPALAIASELIHRDPIPMLRVLHEFAPHLSMAQLQEILGVRAAAPGVDPMSMVGMNLGPAPNSALGKGLPVTGTDRSIAVNNSNRSKVPTLNDIPLRVGAVITEGALAAQFGVGFRATVAPSGRLLQLPHCVQEGDTISVLKSSEVIR